LGINEFGCLAADVNADLSQGLRGKIVDRYAWLGAGRMHLYGVPGDLGHQPSGHLRLAAVLDAHEQYGRLGGFGHRELGDGSDAEVGEQATDALFDVVADGTHCIDGLSGGVGQFPVFVTLAGKKGQASPHPIVTTTSAAWTISSVQGLGNSRVMSMPISAIACTADGLISSPGSDPPDHATP